MESILTSLLSDTNQEIVLKYLKDYVLTNFNLPLKHFENKNGIKNKVRKG